MVHGGGPQLTELSASLGLATQIVDGRRVTDEKSIEVTAMVLNGLINTRILAICRDLNIDAVGISGVDAGLVRAHRRAPVKLEDGSDRTIDYGFVGDIDAVNTAVLLKLLDNGLMPVVSPLSAADPGSLISYTDLRGLQRLRAAGALQEGMLPKAQAIEDALRGGVRRVHIVSYKTPEGILGEIFTNEGTGTLVVQDVNALTPAEITAST